MQDYYRFKVRYDREKGEYTAYCRQTREMFNGKTKHDLWNKIKEDDGYKVNRHFRRKGIWIAVNKPLMEDNAPMQTTTSV